MSTRLAKIATTAACGVLLTLVAVNNVSDYGVNFDVVRHILAMDMIPDGPFGWRAITSPLAHHLLYFFIIAAEFCAGFATLLGVVRLWAQRGATAQAFNRAKELATAGVAGGLLRYLFGFMTVGGEWFQMWRAGPYNMQEPAFRFIGSLGIALIFLSLPDMDE